MNEEVASIFLALKLDNQSLRNQVNSAGTESGNSFATKFSNTMGNVFRYKLASTILSTVQGVWNYWVTGAEDAYEIQLAAEEKLQEVMKTRMNATKEEIQSIKDYASELQQIGIVGDEVTLQGAAQLATYLSSTESLKSLMAAMDDLAVSNGGAFSVSDTTSVANMIGKAIANDSIASLTRVGITFTDEEKARWDTLNTEEQKAAFLSEVIKNNVGDINEAYAKTNAGQLTQMNNYMGDIKEKVGNIKEDLKADFLPLMNKILGWIDEAVDKVQLFVDAFGDFMVDMGWKSANEGLETYKDNIGAATDAINEQQEALENVGLAGFDVFNLLGDSLLAEAENTNQAVGEAAATNANDDKNNPDANPFKKFFEKIENFIKNNKGRWEDFKKTVSNVWNGILNVFTPVWQHLKDKTSELMDKHLEPLKDSFGHLISSWSELWDIVDGNDWLSSTFNYFIDGLVGTLDIVLTLVEDIANTIGGMADFLLDPAGYLNEHIVEPWDNLGETINEELGNWQQNNYDKAVNDGKLFGFIDARNPINTANANNNKVELSDESIKQLASAISRKNTAVQSQPIYIDGKKLTDAVVGTINKSSKYNNGSTLRRY